MSKIPLRLQATSLILVTSLWFTACEVPDISEFSTQSAEMTSGIRRGIKDTQTVLQEQVENISTYEKKHQDRVRRNLEEYKKVMKPTLQTLDALDAYLEALTALAQANKKSGENARAAVSAVSNLVSSVATLPIFPAGSSFKLGDSTVNVATGLVAIEEQFRTAKSFKTRVDRAADIVEGTYIEVAKTSVVNGESRQTKEFKKVCLPTNKKGIENANEVLAKNIAEIKKNPRLSERAKESLISNWREASEQQVRRFGCGVIDLLKFTLQDLRVINNNALPLVYSNHRQKNELTLDLHESIVSNNGRVQNELRFILLYNETIASLRDRYPSVKPPVEETEPVRRRLNNVMQLDGALRATLIQSLGRCSQLKCGPLKDYLRYSQEEFESLIYPQTSLEQWLYTTALLENDLDSRAGVLFDQNAKYLTELGRIKESYSKVTNELVAIKSKRERMNTLIDASEEALDAWAEAHANLRVALHTKKPLKVARLARKVQDIWALFEAPQIQGISTLMEENGNGES